MVEVSKLCESTIRFLVQQAHVGKGGGRCPVWTYADRKELSNGAFQCFLALELVTDWEH
jgi:hypothetical protein